MEDGEAVGCLEDTIVPGLGTGDGWRFRKGPLSGL